MPLAENDEFRQRGLDAVQGLVPPQRPFLAQVPGRHGGRRIEAQKPAQEGVGLGRVRRFQVGVAEHEGPPAEAAPDDARLVAQAPRVQVDAVELLPLPHLLRRDAGPLQVGRPEVRARALVAGNDVKGRSRVGREL